MYLYTQTGLQIMVCKWDITKLKDAVAQSECWADVCRYVGLGIRARAYDTLRHHIKLQNLDTSHFKTLSELSTKRNSRKNIYWTLDNSFTQNCNINRAQLKRIILKNNLIPYICSICKLLPSWNAQELVLQLDHINGTNNDNRLDNLRFLCPNCHTQTHTFSTKRFSNKNKVDMRKGKKPDRMHQRKVEWPTKEKLISLIEEYPMTTIGKMFGVSDNTVRKWKDRYEIRTVIRTY
jgi:hypothetical protein